MLTFLATHITQYMQHGHAIIETWVALMPQCLMIMHDDDHDQDFNCFLTSRMLQKGKNKR